MEAKKVTDEQAFVEQASTMLLCENTKHSSIDRLLALKLLQVTTLWFIRKVRYNQNQVVMKRKKLAIGNFQ